jgi:hypothetical protein
MKGVPRMKRRLGSACGKSMGLVLFPGTWKMLENYRELIAIETRAYESAYGTGEE